MFHKRIIFLFAVTAAIALSGCGGKKDDEPQPTTQAKEETVVTEEDSETEAKLAPITPSDYLVKDVSKYVTLSSLDGLAATQYSYEITDEMVQEQIEEERYMYSDEVEVEKASEGSTVYVDMTSSVQGDKDSELTESTLFTIGDEDYGEEFDAQLLGKSAGDELSFSISYDDDSWFEDWAGKTVDFKVTVTAVYDTIVPDYDDAFIKENTEYESKEEYESALRDMLTDEYAQEGYYEAVDELFQTVIEQSTFNGYPEDLYDDCEAEALSYYAQFLGTDDRDEVLEALGLTAEDLDAEVLDSVNLRLIICAICEANDLEVTEEDYIAGVTESAEAEGYPSIVDYEDVNGRESIVWALYQNMAAEFLYDNAEITPVKASAEDLYGDEWIEIETESETIGADEFYAAELEAAEETEA